MLLKVFDPLTYYFSIYYLYKVQLVNHGKFLSNIGLNTTVHFQEMDSMYGFTQLDALTVISLSITWVFGVLAVICGLRFITKVYTVGEIERVAIEI